MLKQLHSDVIGVLIVSYITTLEKVTALFNGIEIKTEQIHIIAIQSGFRLPYTEYRHIMLYIHMFMDGLIKPILISIALTIMINSKRLI